MEKCVYVVILNYNGWKDTIECLESVLKSAYSNFYTILVDNNSTDDSVDRMKQHLSGGATVFLI